MFFIFNNFIVKTGLPWKFLIWFIDFFGNRRFIMINNHWYWIFDWVRKGINVIDVFCRPMPWHVPTWIGNGFFQEMTMAWAYLKELYCLIICGHDSALLKIHQLKYFYNASEFVRGIFGLPFQFEIISFCYFGYRRNNFLGLLYKWL